MVKMGALRGPQIDNVICKLYKPGVFYISGHIELYCSGIIGNQSTTRVKIQAHPASGEFAPEEKKG